MPFFAFTMMGGLGAVLIFALMTLILGLKKPYLFILAVVVILIGLGVLEHQLDLLTDERDAVVAPDEPSQWDEPIQNLYTAIYAYWQAIMLGFLSLQLYLEKLRRQKPAA
jgi:ABC-type branched-subunit amino acid transport system permease subunit